jgi:hypothetical protein
MYLEVLLNEKDTGFNLPYKQISTAGSWRDKHSLGRKLDVQVHKGFRDKCQKMAVGTFKPCNQIKK